jgi:hypothetical protein
MYIYLRREHDHVRFQYTSYVTIERMRLFPLLSALYWQNRQNSFQQSALCPIYFSQVQLYIIWNSMSTFYAKK